MKIVRHSQLMANRGEIGELVEINRIGAEELLVEWRIQGVLSLRIGTHDYYWSPNFSIGDERWRFRVWPNLGRERQNPAAGRVKIGFSRHDTGPPKTFNFSLGIKGSRGVEKSRKGEWEFSTYDGCYFNCWRSELVEDRTRLMPKGILTITCVLKMPCADRDASVQTDLKAKGGVKALDDFAKLFACGDYSDVTLQVSDVKFKVHKAILFARSPALSTSLQHKSREKALNRIVIEDCEPEVFRGFLHYLYAGSVQLLTGQNVFGLYRVAYKYRADDLKQQCLEYMRDTLSVQTFCNTINLALMHGENDLLQQAIHFGTEHFQSIIRREEWQDFTCDYPTQASEILIKCSGPGSKKTEIGINTMMSKGENCVLTLICILFAFVVSFSLFLENFTFVML